MPPSMTSIVDPDDEPAAALEAPWWLGVLKEATRRNCSSLSSQHRHIERRCTRPYAVHDLAKSGSFWLAPRAGGNRSRETS